jgi:hypothetical protein
MTMQRKGDRDQPTVRPVSIQRGPYRRRFLRRHEMLAFGLLAAIMAGAWIVTLTV